MTRKLQLSIEGRNLDWTLHMEGNGWSIGQIQVALLNDIRTELKSLNTVLHCSNFLDIPHKLDRIKRNTTKKRKRKVVAAKPKLRVVR